MNLKDLLLSKDIDPQHVLVLRHRPLEPDLNKVLPWLAAEPGRIQRLPTNPSQAG